MGLLMRGGMPAKVNNSIGTCLNQKSLPCESSLDPVVQPVSVMSRTREQHGVTGRGG